MDGFEIRELIIHKDQRGWLGEIIRADEANLKPLMAYLSMTTPGTVRGPHEHQEQTDFFCFIGRFRIYLWDNRKTSPTYQENKIINTLKVKKCIIILLNLIFFLIKDYINEVY